MAKRNSNDVKPIINPFKLGCKHDAVFNWLLNGVTFEQLRENLMSKYNDVHTASKPNTRMYIQNVRNRNIPVQYTHQTGIYKIGFPETETKPETKKRNRKPVKPEIDLTTETKPNNPETVSIPVSNETPSNDAETVNVETKPETPSNV